MGKALPDSTINLCRESDAILFGSVGGPKWENFPAEQQPERAALLPLRKLFNLYINLRPATIFPQLISASPLKPEIIERGFDLLICRELTGGIYFGQPKGHDAEKGFDTLVYTKEEISRITHKAFQLAMNRRKKLASIDKANVLHSMVFWRNVVNAIAPKYPEVELTHLFVDNAAMQLIQDPGQFDVLLCGNMFGDILSDEAAVLTGSIGMLASASLGEGPFGLYEPGGGSAPDIAGKGIANPIAQILSAALLFKYSFGLDKAYDLVYSAIGKVLNNGFGTKDIVPSNGKVVSTREMGDMICEYLS